MGDHGARVKFWKLTGSGNDFVFFDGRGDDLQVRRHSDAGFVRALCAQHTGVGADGVGIIQNDADQDFGLIYLNRDGSRGELCGNASLCATRLAVELGIAKADGLTFRTDAGVISGRIRSGRPEIDLQPHAGLRPDAGISRHPGEERLGFVNTGVPHLVVRTPDVQVVDLGNRGPELRFHSSLRQGANVNWVARRPDGSWAMRTYERGVEAETLACGTGAVACAVLLAAWGESGEQTSLQTRSGQTLTVTLNGDDRSRPSLSGEGRLVFEGSLREL